MNVSKKEATILQCGKCPATYMKIGEIATIRLGHPRTPHRNKLGQALIGVCPTCTRERATLT